MRADGTPAPASVQRIEVDEPALAHDHFLPCRGQGHADLLGRHRFRPHWVVAGIACPQLEFVAGVIQAAGQQTPGRRPHTPKELDVFLAFRRDIVVRGAIQIGLHTTPQSAHDPVSPAAEPLNHRSRTESEARASPRLSAGRWVQPPGALRAAYIRVAAFGPEACRRRFLRFFPDGFADETYLAWERDYKA